MSAVVVPQSLASLAPARQSGTVLMVGHTPELQRTLQSYLNARGHSLRCVLASSLQDAEAWVKHRGPSVVLGSPTLPESLPTLTAEWQCDLPVLALTAHATGESSHTAISQGYTAVVSADTPDALQQLEHTLLRELELQRLRRSLTDLNLQLGELKRHYPDLMERSQASATVQNGVIITASQGFVTALGRTEAADIVGFPLTDLVIAEHRARVRERVYEYAHGRSGASTLQFAVRCNNTDVHYLARFHQRDQDGESCLEIKLSRSQSKDGAEDSSAKALTDNRRALLRALESRPVSGDGALVLVVLDDFPRHEHRWGVIGVEAVTEAMEGVLGSAVGVGDGIFRLSPSEYVLTLARTDPTVLQTDIQFLHGQLNQLVLQSEGGSDALGCTVAWTPWRGGLAVGGDFQELVVAARADSAHFGRRLMSPEIAGARAPTAPAAAASLQLSERLSKLSDYRLVFQQMTSLEGDPRPHYDVLLRFQTEDGNLIPAGELLPKLQELRMLGEVDRWVTSRSQELVAERRDPQQGPVLFVRLSESSVGQLDRTLHWLNPILKSAELPPGQLVFEITEPTLRHQLRKSQSLARTIVEAGQGFSVSQFGAAGDSEALIRQLPHLSHIKFHGQYARILQDRLLSRRLTALAESLRPRKIRSVITEVEDSAIVPQLWQLGINFVLGYRLHAPEPILHQTLHQSM